MTDSDAEFPGSMTIVLLAVPGEYDGLHKMFVHGEPQGLIDKMRAAEGLPFQVEVPRRRGGRRTIWLNPSAIAYFTEGPPVGGTLGYDDPAT